MRTTVRTYQEWHLGDNLIHLHFLRSIAAANPDVQFIHAAQECYVWQMSEMVADLANISLIPLADAARQGGHTWHNSWKNAEGYFDSHPRGRSFCEFHLDWFAHLASRIGFASPFMKNEDLRFDYPALFRITERFPPDGDFDFLVINSMPCSGQMPAYNSPEYLDPLLAELVGAGHSVVVTQPTKVQQSPARSDAGRILCTMDYKASVTDIGRLSRRCKHHLMVSTGPALPVLNKWNLPSDNLRVIMIGTEQLNFPSLRHAANREQCREFIVERGLL